MSIKPNKLKETKETIFNSCRTGNLYKVQQYVNRGGDVYAKNRDDETIFFVACKYANIPLCEYLFSKYGVTILSTKDNKGRTPLFMVVEKGLMIMVYWLFDHGACGDMIKVNCDNMTPVSMACKKNFVDIVIFLCEIDPPFNASLTINMLDNLNKSALDYAYENRRKSKIFVYILSKTYEMYPIMANNFFKNLLKKVSEKYKNEN